MKAIFSLIICKGHHMSFVWEQRRGRKVAWVGTSNRWFLCIKSNKSIYLLFSVNICYHHLQPPALPAFLHSASANKTPFCSVWLDMWPHKDLSYDVIIQGIFIGAIHVGTAASPSNQIFSWNSFLPLSVIYSNILFICAEMLWRPSMKRFWKMLNIQSVSQRYFRR